MQSGTTTATESTPLLQKPSQRRPVRSYTRRQGGSVHGQGFQHAPRYHRQAMPAGSHPQAQQFGLAPQVGFKAFILKKSIDCGNVETAGEGWRCSLWVMVFRCVWRCQAGCLGGWVVCVEQERAFATTQSSCFV